MPKCLLLAKFLQTKVSVLLAYLVCGVVVVMSLISYGYSNYEHIPVDEIENQLFKEVSPNLVIVPSRPKCSYDFIRSTVSYNKVSLNFDDFSANGIENGSYSPPDCTPLFSVAILVTYRNRQSQLNIFLPYMHNFLRKQNIHYKIFLIEQQDMKPWNKGALYNIGAKHAMIEKFPCLILHDVDLLPLDESNIYACFKQPRHASASIDKLRNVLPYTWLVGGVLAIRTEQYVVVNGFSNKFIDWGGEDDNFYQRLEDHQINLIRLPREMSQYLMLPHKRQKVNNLRYDMMQADQLTAHQDGLDSVRYQLVHVKRYRLFTFIGVQF